MHGGRRCCAEILTVSARASAPDSLAEVEIRDSQEDQENQRIDDEQDADPGIATGEMGDAGRDQGDGEAEIGELPDLGRDPRDQQRRDSQDLGDRELSLEVAGQSQVDESSLRKREAVDEGEVDDAEDHHGTDDPRGDPVDDPFSSRLQEHVTLSYVRQMVRSRYCMSSISSIDSSAPRSRLS